MVRIVPGSERELLVGWNWTSDGMIVRICALESICRQNQAAMIGTAYSLRLGPLDTITVSLPVLFRDIEKVDFWVRYDAGILKPSTHTCLVWL